MSETDQPPTIGCQYPDTFAGRLRALADAWRNRVPDNGVIAEGPDYGAPYLLWSDLDAALTEIVQLDRKLDNERFEAGIAVRELRTELARVRTELNARIAAESVDAAAGSYAGRAEQAEAARDAAQAEATLLRRALIGRRAFPVGVMRTPMDERTEAIRALWDEFCFSGPSETDRERDQVIGWLLDQVDNATARAEQAEAALAEMREANGSHPRCCTCGKNLGYRNIGNQLFCWPCADGESPEPRTALERAADEQGDGEGGGA